jgi:SNF2 family DNA or RNA helicase
MLMETTANVTPITKATAEVLKPLRRFKYGATLKLSTYGKDSNSFLLELPFARTSWPCDLKKWVRTAFAEQKWLGSKNQLLEDSYQISATDMSALVLVQCVHPEDLVYGDEVAELNVKYLIQRLTSFNRRAKMQADYKLDGVSPPMPIGWIDHPTYPLSKCQQAAVAFSLGHEATALFMDRGVGKTATTINIFCNEVAAKRPHMYRVLIVCPNQVRANWRREIIKFATVSGKITIIRGNQEARMRQFVQAAMPEEDCEFSAIIIGYDTLTASPELYVQRRMWDRVICDESHYFKSDRTDRWKKAMRLLRDACHRRTILTGTPIGNSIMDIWTQLEFLGNGLSGFSKFGEFRSYHGSFIDIGDQGVKKLVSVENAAVLQERLARLAFTVTKEEAGLDLPDKVYDTYEVSMTAKQERVYKQIAEECFAEIEDRLSGDSSAMTIENALVTLLRLAQITSGFFTSDKVIDPDTGEVLQERTVQQIDTVNPKIEAVSDMLDESDPLAKVIIWCCFVEDIHQLIELCKRKGIKHGAYYGETSDAKRDEFELAFNADPDFKVLIANPQTAGEGLNLLGYVDDLETYCDHEIFFSQNWSAILRGQAEDRAHRRGTKMPVRITDLLVPGTIDEEIRNRVSAKQTNALTIMDVRDILKRL